MDQQPQQKIGQETEAKEQVKIDEEPQQVPQQGGVKDFSQELLGQPVQKKMQNRANRANKVVAPNKNQIYSGNYGNRQPVRKEPSMNLLNLKEEDKHKEVIALIVSFKSGSSYDKLFTQVEQESMEGTKVLVYECSSSMVTALIDGFQKQEYANEVVKGFFGYLKDVDPDCVVFNWECCSGYGQKTFPETGAQLFSFLEIIIQKGHMAMFSDFSLKALINEWPKETKLGSNPFIQTSECGGQNSLYFQADILQQCPSSQLQTVGQMSEKNFVNFNAAGGTIVYGVRNQQIKNQENPYNLQVLTVANSDKYNMEPKYQCQVGEHKGAAGHVLLSYKSGGFILTSMGHWIELMKLDTSQKKFIEIAKQEFGENYAKERMRQMESLGDAERRQYVETNAKRWVQNQAPCRNMDRKRR